MTVFLKYHDNCLRSVFASYLIMMVYIYIYVVSYKHIFRFSMKLFILQRTVSISGYV